MKPDFFDLLEKHNGHSSFLNTEAVVKAMKICYQLGLEDGNNEVLEFFSKMEHLSDNIEYIKEEWQNQKIIK